MNNEIWGSTLQRILQPNMSANVQEIKKYRNHKEPTPRILATRDTKVGDSQEDI